MSAPKPKTPPITPPTIAPMLEEPLLLEPFPPEGVEVEVKVVLVVEPRPVTVLVVDGPFEEEGATLVVEVLNFSNIKLVPSFSRTFDGQPYPAVPRLTRLR